MSPDALESIISAGERPQTLDRVATGIDQQKKMIGEKCRTIM